MNENEMALNAAMFAVAKLIDEGSTAYCTRDKAGKLNQMEWRTVIRLLYDMLREAKDAD